MTKIGYADSLKQLEKISEEIHERRRKESSKVLAETLNHETNAKLGTRQDGVGAEFPSPCPGKKKSKQSSENPMDSKSNKTDVAKIDIAKNQLKCDSSADCHIDESLTLNSDSEINDPGSVGKKAGCDEIDSLPLIGNLKISKKYKYGKDKKRRKKNERHQHESLPNLPQGSKLKKKAINRSLHIKESSEKSHSGSTGKETQQPDTSGKRISISSSSTTESAGNDPTSALDSILSNCSESSSRETVSSSSSVSSSSESPSPEQSPKLIYERLTSTESADKKFHILSKGCSSSGLSDPCYKSNLGLPIHPFENNVGFDMADTGANVKVQHANTLNSPTSSPVKKNLYSPTKLTNKYLSIKQEESEMSDAESLAR